MSALLESIQTLTKALEAGNITGAPGTLVQGAALQIQEMEGVMRNVTFGREHIKLQKEFSVKKAKSTLVRFKRQLSYGEFGGSAQYEGMVGQEETGDYVEAVVPMAFYSHVRRVTVAANMVDTIDGVKAEDREAENAAMKIAADMEHDCFQGKAHFSNAGVFDGNPMSIAALPNLPGLDVQVRQSDLLSNTQDLMFAEFGSSESVVLAAGGALLNQSLIEDAALRSRLNFGKAERLFVDPVVLSGYNKLILQTSGNVTQFATMGSALTSSGADLRSQNVSEGSVKIETSHFLRGDKKPARARSGAPASPTLASAASPTGGSLAAGDYWYRVTAVNEKGEGTAAELQVTGVSANDAVTFTITANGAVGTRFYNVYRTEAGAAKATARFIGRMVNPGATATFTDLGNKKPGFVNGYMIEKDSAAIHELAPYSRMKLGISDLSVPEAHFCFRTLAVYEPRKSVIVDNLKGSVR
jgi:hypothetical protein